MKAYGLRLRRHYSGLLCAHCRDLPGWSVMGRDQEEIELLAREAIVAEIRRCQEAGETIAEPLDSGHFRVTVALAESASSAR